MRSTVGSSFHATPAQYPANYLGWFGALQAQKHENCEHCNNMILKNSL